MKSVDFLPMPEKVLSEVTVYMDEREKREYDRLKNDLVLELDGEEVTAANAAALCNKLSQMANGAVYTDDGKTKVFHSRKLDALEDMIEAANGHPVMVVYWFKSDLSRIEERLREKGITFERLDDSESIERGTRGEIPVLLLSPASAAHGLNLQSGGSHIIWFGLTWSLELYQQTNGRLWRQGQKAETVVINHIITEGTIDERILAVLKNKDATQEELIAAVKAEV
jgi:SNF2 family DNA or RNA helicase